MKKIDASRMQIFKTGLNLELEQSLMTAYY